MRKSPHFLDRSLGDQWLTQINLEMVTQMVDVTVYW